MRTHYNRVRHRRRRAETTATDLDDGAFEAALAAWRPMETPAEDTDRRLLGDRLGAALDDLTPELRSTIWLVDVEGFTQREAAAMQEIPEGTVASRLFRARRQLRDVLEAVDRSDSSGSRRGRQVR